MDYSKYCKKMFYAHLLQKDKVYKVAVFDDLADKFFHQIEVILNYLLIFFYIIF